MSGRTGVFEKTLRTKIENSKVFVVGAGGIGCEILKNLVLSGFPYIEIIDLDTVDVSNLNRQFLFHKEHVGKSKAEVAKQSALVFNPLSKIKTYHDSIFNTKFGTTFFKRFDLVLNALDNYQARNHVNRMCLTADVPLIESGTAGYNGQVELIKKGLTKCYECTPKAAQKSYPGCTIRNTPSEPIHCIVWAKHLFNQLFGETNDDENVSPDMADPESGGDQGANALNTDANKDGNVERVNTREWAQKYDYNPEMIFNKLFHDDIQYLLSMSDLWKTRTPPQPIKWSEIPTETVKTGDNVLPDQRIWSLCECSKIFAQSVYELKSELSKRPENDHLIWDKDDKFGMDFVSACANIRAIIFKIPVKSRFDVKSMAGNIIPAIATTNAMTAGVVVMHAFKVLLGNYESCKSVYLRSVPNPRNQILVPEKVLENPNPKCIVCSEKPTVYLKVDTDVMTVKELRGDVLIKALNMVSPDVILDSKGLIIISSEEGETDDNNDKKLSELFITDGAVLKVDDFFLNYELTVVVIHAESTREGPLFEVNADEGVLQPKLSAEEVKKLEEDIVSSSTSDPEPTTSNDNTTSSDEGPSSSKRTRINVDDDSDDDCCIINDDDDVVMADDSKEKPSTTTTTSTITTTTNTATTSKPPNVTGVKRKTNDFGEGSSSETSNKRPKLSRQSSPTDLDDDDDDDEDDDDDVITILDDDDD